MIAKTWIEISASTLRQNFRSVRRLVAPARVMAVVKANAYGHGLEEVAAICAEEGADWFGVDRVEEALALREAGIRASILVLGYTTPDGMKAAVKNDISLTVYTNDMVKAAERAAAGLRRANLHVKVETGLHRQGAEGKELAAMLKLVKASPRLRLEGLSTHFANIEDTSDPSFAQSQLERFAEADALVEKTGLIPTVRHTACSAAALVYPETRFNLIRLGISLYGMWSSELTELAMRATNVRLKPALTWKTQIAQVKAVKKGDPVSYGLTERMPTDGRIAVLPIGYYDGFDRVAMSSKGEVLIGGKRCKVVGRICMNMCMVDVSQVRSAKAGDEVVLIGSQGKETIRAEELAMRAGTIQYEIVARLNPLIEKHLVK
jgi:alanine racemase